MVAIAFWFKLWEALQSVEVWGFITTLVCVWLVARSSVWNFPVGIIACVLAAVVNIRLRLYSDAGLQGVFIVLGIYGWIEWLRKPAGLATEPEVPITRTSLQLWGRLGAFVVCFTAGAGYFFDTYTNAAAPYLDNFATGVSIAAQYQIARKKVENWLLWLGVDALYTWLYWQRGSVLFSILYFILMLLAAYGYWEWRQLLRRAATAAARPVVPPVAAALEEEPRQV
ncbi:nicotinamide riboside transporter PnuC [Hymenobacter gummosus]|uniref:nicotinamide riboside transporter PnuC n=1 Tax=Hymenobacter gummosus TaxID=1776032 RepID=UPI001404E889|nr:nicotinamide riboside transporter PnuC [Hymenobacter gummosus]